MVASKQEAEVVVSSRRVTAHRKVHVSLPADVYDRVEARSSLAGASFSATISELVRRALEREDQARLEEALKLDFEANVAFARAVSVVTARVWSASSEPEER